MIPSLIAHLPKHAVFVVVLLLIGLLYLRIVLPWLRQRRKDEIVAGTPPEHRADVAEGLALLEAAESRDPALLSLIATRRTRRHDSDRGDAS